MSIIGRSPLKSITELFIDWSFSHIWFSDTSMKQALNEPLGSWKIATDFLKVVFFSLPSAWCPLLKGTTAVCLNRVNADLQWYGFQLLNQGWQFRGGSVDSQHGPLLCEPIPALLLYVGCPGREDSAAEEVWEQRGLLSDQSHTSAPGTLQQATQGRLRWLPSIEIFKFIIRNNFKGKEKVENCLKNPCVLFHIYQLLELATYSLPFSLYTGSCFLNDVRVNCRSIAPLPEILKQVFPKNKRTHLYIQSENVTWYNNII